MSERSLHDPFVERTAQRFVWRPEYATSSTLAAHSVVGTWNDAGSLPCSGSGSATASPHTDYTKSVEGPGTTFDAGLRASQRVPAAASRATWRHVRRSLSIRRFLPAIRGR